MKRLEANTTEPSLDVNSSGMEGLMESSLTDHSRTSAGPRSVLQLAEGTWRSTTVQAGLLTKNILGKKDRKKGKQEGNLKF